MYALRLGTWDKDWKTCFSRALSGCLGVSYGGVWLG